MLVHCCLLIVLFCEVSSRYFSFQKHHYLFQKLSYLFEKHRYLFQKLSYFFEKLSYLFQKHRYFLLKNGLKKREAPKIPPFFIHKYICFNAFLLLLSCSSAPDWAWVCSVQICCLPCNKSIFL